MPHVIGDLLLPGLGAALACAVMGFPRMVRAMRLSAVTVRFIIGVARKNRTAPCASGRA